MKAGLGVGATAVALCLGAGAVAQTVGGPAGGALYGDYLAELSFGGAQYVAVSNHFRHEVDCSGAGCVIQGPMESREACEAWADAWNRLDPYDHARCQEAASFPPLPR